jgi:hypothetical protein
MRYSWKARIGGAVRLILAGTVLGTLAAIGYAALCGIISWALVSAVSWMNAGNIERAMALGLRFAIAGAVAGAIVGALSAIDRSVDRKVPPPFAGEKHRAGRLAARSTFRNGTPYLN